jgi:hypothetical protein
MMLLAEMEQLVQLPIEPYPTRKMTLGPKHANPGLSASRVLTRTTLTPSLKLLIMYYLRTPYTVHCTSVLLRAKR